MRFKIKSSLSIKHAMINKNATCKTLSESPKRTISQTILIPKEGCETLWKGFLGIALELDLRGYAKAYRETEHGYSRQRNTFLLLWQAWSSAGALFIIRASWNMENELFCF